MLQALAFGVVLGFPSPAVIMAHDWYWDKHNPVTGLSCCNDKDCKVITEDMWQVTGDKIMVQWYDGITYSIPANQARPSEDKKGRAVACVLFGNMRCFFLPTFG